MVKTTNESVNSKSELYGGNLEQRDGIHWLQNQSQLNPSHPSVEDRTDITNGYVM